MEGRGSDSSLSHDLTKRTALFEFMMLKLNREVLGQVPSICHLVNFGAIAVTHLFIGADNDRKLNHDTLILLEVLPSNKLVDPC